MAKEPLRPFVSLLAVCVVAASMEHPSSPAAEGFERARQWWTSTPPEAKRDLLVHACRLALLAIALAVDTEGKLWPKALRPQSQAKVLRRSFDTCFLRPFALTRAVPKRNWAAFRYELRILCCMLATPVHLARLVTVEELNGDFPGIATAPLEAETLHAIGHNFQAALLHLYQEEYPSSTAFLAYREMLATIACAAFMIQVAHDGSRSPCAFHDYILEAQTIFADSWFLVLRVESILKYSLDRLWEQPPVENAPLSGKSPHAVAKEIGDLLERHDALGVVSILRYLLEGDPALQVENAFLSDTSPDDMRSQGPAGSAVAENTLLADTSPDANAQGTEDFLQKHRALRVGIFQEYLLERHRAAMYASSSDLRRHLSYARVKPIRPVDLADGLSFKFPEVEGALPVSALPPQIVSYVLVEPGRQRIDKFSNFLLLMGIMPSPSAYGQLVLQPVADDETTSGRAALVNLAVKLKAAVSDLRGFLIQLPKPHIQASPDKTRGKDEGGNTVRDFSVDKSNRQPPAAPACVFVCYCLNNDDEEKKLLLEHLNVLKLMKDMSIEIWTHDCIGPGGDSAAETERAIRRADVAVLLVTVHFLNSYPVLNDQVPRLLERHQGEGLRVIPVIGRHCAWKEVDWLAKMSVRPRNGVPVWREAGGYAADKALTDIVKEIAAIIRSKQYSRPFAAA